jgi:tight adherence protein B
MTGSPLLAAIVSAVAVLAASVAVLAAPVAVADARARRRARPSAPGLPVPAMPRHGVPDSLNDAARRCGRLVAVASGRSDREARRADQALPAVLDQVTRQLRTGSSLAVAVRSATTAADDRSTARLADDLGAGVALVAAVERWRTAVPTPARHLVAAAIGLAAEAGGAVAVVLDGVTDTLRDRVALDREVAALSSQARASAAVLVAAPVAFAVLASSADRRVAQALLGHPLGWACLAAGAILDVVGAVWMARLVARAR